MARKDNKDMTKSKLYTRTGDGGTTLLASGARVDKLHPRIEAYGTIDELNSHLGLLLSYPLPPELSATLSSIQLALFDLGTHLATDASSLPAESPLLKIGITDTQVHQLEVAIDLVDSLLPPLHTFVMPGGCTQAAQAHVCRTVARRAERCIVALAQTAPVAPQALRYINRLSDYLFAAARYCNIYFNHREIFWQKNC